MFKFIKYKNNLHTVYIGYDGYENLIEYHNMKNLSGHKYTFLGVCNNINEIANSVLYV